MSERAVVLRQAFDHSFSLAPAAAATAAESLLAITIGTTRFVVRLAEVSSLHADKKITRVPSPVAELLGIAGLRGTVLPVYDLAMLMGFPKAATPRWLLITAGVPVGFAFESFDGYESAPIDAIVPEVRADARRHVRDILRTGGARPIIHVPSILETIRARSGYES